MRQSDCDLLVVGGGINGAGIARDAAGRGLAVVLAEKDDLASHTSSASSKLVHGGLRYLEYFEFRLVAESLAEREVLLKSAPHLVHPMRFVMPHVPTLRPAWMIRVGLFLYDHLARRRSLGASEQVRLDRSSWGAGLKPDYRNGFVYADCWVDDARLVIATARDAADRGARILPRTECVEAHREDGRWQVRLRDAAGVEEEIGVRALVNAAGPWVQQTLAGVVHRPSPARVRLVRGSHIVVPRLYDGEHAYILQNDDRRVVFATPFFGDWTLVGTTEVEISDPSAACEPDPWEVEYLCRAVNRYFTHTVTPEQVVWRFSGVRPLFDDGSGSASAVTRDYVLEVDAPAGSAPLVSVFGGKITTYRRLAEEVLGRLAPAFPELGPAWTAEAALPGGGRAPDAVVAELARQFPAVPSDVLEALAGRHGSLAAQVLEGVRSAADLGTVFGAGLCAREVDWLVAREWARTGEDVLWRRTKAGLRLCAAARDAVAAYVATRVAAGMAPMQ